MRAGCPSGGLRERLAEAGAPTTISFLYSVDEIRHRECTLLLYRGELSAKPDLADRENWRFFDAVATPWEDLLDYQTRMTLKRYFQERSQGRFGLFAETGEGRPYRAHRRQTCVRTRRRTRNVS